MVEWAVVVSTFVSWHALHTLSSILVVICVIYAGSKGAQPDERKPTLSADEAAARVCVAYSS